MKVATVTLKSVSPYSQSKMIGIDKRADESHDDFEKRSWRERIHADANGLAYIPPMSFKKALDGAARYRGLKIVGGRGSATYTKNIESGTFIVDPLRLNVKRDDVPGEWLSLDANGKKGKASSGRVSRCMPRFDYWEGQVKIYIIDEIVLHTKPGTNITVLEFFLRTAGSLIGIGRFRPENGGFYGRFVVTNFTVAEEAEENVA